MSTSPNLVPLAAFAAAFVASRSKLLF